MNLELSKIEDILAAYPIEFAYLYGSFAEGSNRPWSDFDIALIVADSVPANKSRPISPPARAGYYYGAG